jgi:hypothetical protein
MFRSKSVDPGSSSPLTAYDLWGFSQGWCNQEVAGESYHLDALERLFSHPLVDHEEVVTSALLIREPDNPHDAKAVAVQVDGATVGHLPREVAPRYQQILQHLERHGFVAQVPCRVWGGSYTDYDYDDSGRLRTSERFNAGVWVGLGEPHLCIPGNTPPEEGYVILPDGGAIQVSGEERHMPSIEPLLRLEGECWAYATLHEIEDTGARVNKERVEVRFGGSRVGQLTPKMSGDLLPAIRHLEDLGYRSVAKATVKGNRLKAEVVLHCARSHELPSEWPAVIDRIGHPQSRSPANLEPAEVGAAPTGSTDGPRGERRQTPVTIPPKPTRIRFAAPPGWPVGPEGWEPYDGWQPDPTWPPAPASWRFWVAE